MKHKLGFRLITLMVVLYILALMSCTQKQNWPQFRGPESNMVVATANLPEEWGNDNNVKWTAALDGTGWSSPVVWGDKVFITSAYPEKVNPAPERGPMQGPAPQGGQGLQPGQIQQPEAPSQPGQGPQPGQIPTPGQGPQPGQAAQQQDIPDTSFKKEIYRWEVK